MTKIITRYFDSAEKAKAARRQLVDYQRLSWKIVDLYETADGLAEKLVAQNVVDATAKAYETRLAKGGALLLVRAGAKPLRVAQITRDVTAEKGAVDMGDLVEEVEVKDPLPKMNSSILEGHPLMLSRARDPHSTNYHMADYPIPLISRRVPGSPSLFPLHARMANFPIPLTNRRKPNTNSIFSRHARMANFPIGLISRRKPFTGSIIPRHARMADLFLPLISRRKPYTGSIIPRHGRMATVPFPLLINGKEHTNALIPGAPRMANFPIPLLSSRKPYTGSVIPKHGRMATFPFPLLSSRKPYTGSAIPKHGRMADMFLPLISKRAEGERFSFSKALGLKTLIRR